ncbi:TauD/TfdA family dioxygenase [Legionella fairfieldensis]|uniref:TauD/TfdA family dioxygenase n=1 Tax=Legionella fairfieldensis TaxID=45064 RepID=UPI00048D22FB|nr:TauD/TfdA family dioxygenase [Legionella fairfieldensis]
MNNRYSGVITRFLRNDERLILSEEKEMPLVIEANGANDLEFLQRFLASHYESILNDLSIYGAVLLRGFDVHSDEDFEKTVTTIPGLRGISDAFMSEEGRIHASNLKFVLYTNAIYKTGGTLYLGGFHTENYYTPDVPSYIAFCCHKPSLLGGETGLINTEKLYQSLDPSLTERLEKNTWFVAKWLVSEAAERYKIAPETVEKIAMQFDLPVVGDKDKFILMYKPSVLLHPVTQKKALQINLFEIPSLNAELRKSFMQDYQGKTWFWHRFVWKLPSFVFHFLESFYVMLASFFYSPKESLHLLRSKWMIHRAQKKLPSFNNIKVGSCFNKKDIQKLAKSMRNHYSSFLWKKGDILLVDNRKVMHAGMPGSGPRLVRALICNPIDMQYSFLKPGYLPSKERVTETIGFYMTTGNLPDS